MTTDSEMEREIIQEFLVESHDNLDQLDRDLVALERDPSSRELLGSIFRTIHTIKGTSGFLAFGRLESLAHVGENVLARLRDGKLVLDPEITTVLLRMVDAVRAMLAHIEADGTEGDAPVDAIVAALQQVLEPRPAAAPVEPAVEPVAVEPVSVEPVAVEPVSVEPVAVEPVAVQPVAVELPAAAEPPTPAEPAAVENSEVRATETSIRVDVELLETLVRLAGELVLARNQIVQRATGLADEDLNRVCHRLDQVTSELQEGVMRTRMQPIDHIWSKLPRVVRDLGAQLGRSVDLRMDGGETELDRTLLEAIKDPLTHLVRNAVDHGIEDPATRVAAGKSPRGVLQLRAAHEGGQIVVEVTDDGRGLDPARLGARAVEKGLVRPEALAGMSPSELTQLVFVPGFSTATTVTNVSGRGVGMDVVRTNIERIGGSIDVESDPGHGTVWRLRIPLTLAIVPALKLLCAGQRFAIPQTNLLELVDLPAGTALERVGGAEVHRLRGTLLPILRLDAVLGVESDHPADAGIVIAVLESDGRRFGLVVDRVLDTEDIVVKPVSQAVKDIGLFAGATIMGDGRVSLILDVQNLTRRAMRSQDVGSRSSQQAGVGAGTTTAARRAQLLVVDAGGGRRVAIPLTAVTRLEQFDRADIEQVGHREVVRYRGQIMPLTRLSDHLGTMAGGDGDSVAGVVYSEHGRSVALAVDRILDIEDDDGTVYSDVDDAGLIGSALIRERVTGMLDVRAAILAADPRFYDSLLPGGSPVDGAEVPV